jgi:hypothetical protein
LDRRFQTWGAYLHILSPPGEQRFYYNRNIIRRSVSSTTSLEAHYQTDQRRRFILNTTLFGTIRGRHEGSSLYMKLYPRWVLHPRLILGAYTTIAESYNNLQVIGSIQGKWLFERYQSRTLYTGIDINYFLNKRWWAGVEVSWNDEWRRQREAVLLQADKSLTPVPDYTLAVFQRVNEFNFRASLQWQLRQIDYLRLSYSFSERNYGDQELQLRMIFSLDGPK